MNVAQTFSEHNADGAACSSSSASPSSQQAHHMPSRSAASHGGWLAIAQRPIVLVGPMGAGKTTIGSMLAKRLHRRFVDSDHELEAQTGVSVATIFEIEGEVAFREREAQLLAQLCVAGENIVLSTGGGSILRDTTRALIRERAAVIYLHAAPEVSYERVKRAKDRPLLKTDDPLAKLKSLYDVRNPLYVEAAHLRVETHRERTSIVIDEILSQLA